MSRDRQRRWVQVLLVVVFLSIVTLLARRDLPTERWHEVFLSAGVVFFVAILLAFGAWRLQQETRDRAATDAQLAEHIAALERAASERDDAYAALSATQARFQAIMDHAPIAVLVKDLKFRYTFVNRAFETWSGLSSADLVGKTVRDVLPADEAEFQIAHAREVVEKLAPIQREVSISLPAGARTALYIKFPIFDAGGTLTAIGGVAVDITVLQQMGAQLAQSQKMEAVGQLTGGIAHDFNNLLTAILINADILVQQLGSDPNLHPLAQMTFEAAERGAQLTSRLLAFSRRQMLEARTVDVNALVAGMQQLMQRSLGAHVAMALRLRDGLPPAQIDPHQLETALLNLAVNARDAMPDGGTLTIETAKVALDESSAPGQPEVAPGEYVMVAVSDTGSGMPAEVAARAFEPFFTTKEVGRGTGLGLSMVYGFVKQSGGYVMIYSEPGVGTAVKLYLPKADAASAGAAQEPSAPPLLPTGTETILLVEDDRLVRVNTETQLVRLGYTVMAAENAADAMAQVAAGLSPALLFTDVVMPGRLNGFELAQRLRERLPGLKVLFTSGYPQGATLLPGGVSSGNFLGKPFRRRDLAVKIREALDKSAA